MSDKVIRNQCTQCHECNMVFTGDDNYLTRCPNCGGCTFKNWKHEVFVKPPDREIHLKRDELLELYKQVCHLKYRLEEMFTRAENEEHLDEAFKEARCPA